MSKNVKTKVISFLPIFIPCALAFTALIFQIYSGQKVLEEKIDRLREEVRQANLGAIQKEIENNKEQIADNKSRIVRLENYEFNNR